MKKLTRREILLDDGSRIVAIEEPEPSGTEPDYNFSNNVYRIAPDGKVLWQINAGEGMDGRAPFTSVRIDKQGRLMAFRWDGSDFAVDVDTGVATYLGFPK